MKHLHETFGISRGVSYLPQILDILLEPTEQHSYQGLCCYLKYQKLKTVEFTNSIDPDNAVHLMSWNYTYEACFEILQEFILLFFRSAVLRENVEVLS